MGAADAAACLASYSKQSSFIALCGESSPSLSTMQFNTAYTYNSAGKGVCWPFVAPSSDNLTDIYFYCSAKAGTGTTTLQIEVREGINGTDKPGSTLTGSVTNITVSATGWVHVTCSIALTAGKMYCVVIGDPSGGSTNNITIGTTGSSNSPTHGRFTGPCNNTTDGWVSVKTVLSGPFFGAVKVGSRWIGGICWDTMATVSSGTYERGQRFQYPTPMAFAGLFDAQADLPGATPLTIKLYDDNTAAGGTPLVSYSYPAITLNNGTRPVPLLLFLPEANWYIIQPNTWYRAVILPGSASTIPRKNYQNNGGSPLTLPADVITACFPSGGNCMWTDYSNGSSWTNDANSLCVAGPILMPVGANSLVLVEDD